MYYNKVLTLNPNPNNNVNTKHVEIFRTTLETIEIDG